MTELKLPTLEQMLEAGMHFGHTTSRWHPKMEPYLYGKRNSIHIIDLAKTQDQLSKAVDFATKLSSSGRKILFVGVKPLARSVIKESAERCKSPYAVNRWIGGTITNWDAVFGMVKRLKQLEEDKKSGKLAKYTKYEQMEFEEEHEKLEEGVGGLRDLTKRPDAIFIVDAKYDKTAVREANKLRIPIIGIADSNINPLKITYPIPGNDDALKSISMIANIIADAISYGKVGNNPKSDN